MKMYNRNAGLHYEDVHFSGKGDINDENSITLQRKEINLKYRPGDRNS